MPRTPALKHPADGLYYLDKPMLDRCRACSGHKDLWVQTYGSGRTPMTLANLMAHVRNARRAGNRSPVGWLLHTMREAGQLHDSEFDLFYGRYLCSDSWKTDVRILLDALEARARREGRLA